MDSFNTLIEQLYFVYYQQSFIVQNFISLPLWLVQLIFCLIPLALGAAVVSVVLQIRNSKKLKKRIKKVRVLNHISTDISSIELEQEQPVPKIENFEEVDTGAMTSHKIEENFKNSLPDNFIEENLADSLSAEEHEQIKQTLKRLQKQYQPPLWQLHKLFLNSPDKKHLGAFLHKTENLLKKKGELLEQLIPFFMFDHKTGNFKRLEHFTETNRELDELWEFWQQGYIVAELAILLIFYLWLSEEREQATKSILQIMSLKDIQAGERSFLHFYFQDILRLNIAPQELPAVVFSSSLAAPRFCYSVDFCQFIQKPLNRLQFMKLHREFYTIENHENLWRKTFEFYSNTIYNNASTFLQIFLLLNYRSFYAETSEQFLLRMTFQYGRYDRLRLIDGYNENPLYRSLDNPLNGKENQKNYSQILFFINSQQNSDFHLFYFLMRQNMNSSLLKSLTIENANSLYLQIVDRQKKPDSTGLMPVVFTRYILFLYFAHRREFDKIIPLYKHLGKFQQEMLCGFFYARALFSTGQIKKSQIEILKLLDRYHDNLYVLNEAAIYSFHAGDLDQAAQIFETMKALYPNEPATKYNEAVFFEYQAQLAVEQKWREYGELSA